MKLTKNLFLVGGGELALAICLASILTISYVVSATADVPKRHYDKWFNHYTDSFVSKIFLKSRTRTSVDTTMDQARELIKAVHDMSGGIHQIIYLVGWQHDGHDSKFPDMSVVGPQCRSSLSDDPLTSLRMVMREAREKYNCDLSLHINMSDCHTDSPAWQAYNDKKLLRLNREGKIVKCGFWYQISHTKDWKSGFAKKHIDDLLEMIPELRQARTIHIDALYARPSEADGITLDDDKVAIKAITDYWHSRGIDVTNEFITSLDMIGWFPMVYHYNFDERMRMIYPIDVVCGGDNEWNGRLVVDYHSRNLLNGVPAFSSPTVGCLYDEAWGIGHFGDMNPDHLDKQLLGRRLFRTGLLFAWYNRQPLVRHEMTSTNYTIIREGGVVANVRMVDRYLTVKENGRTVVDGTDYFLDMPYGGGLILAHSTSGCDREFTLPAAWRGTKCFAGTVYPAGTPCALAVSDGKVRIKLAACESIVLHRK